MVEVDHQPYTLTLVTAPSAEPLDATEAKLHSHIDHSPEDATITHLINCARVYVETITGRALVTQTWKAFYDSWPQSGTILHLPKGPIQSITHVKYYDTTESPTTWSASNYILDGDSNPPRLSLAYNASWPSATLRPIRGVEVQFICGYGNASAVPSVFKHAMYLLIEDWYRNRSEEIIENRVQTVSRRLELGVSALLANYTIY